MSIGEHGTGGSVITVITFILVLGIVGVVGFHVVGEMSQEIQEIQESDFAEAEKDIEDPYNPYSEWDFVILMGAATGAVIILDHLFGLGHDVSREPGEIEKLKIRYVGGELTLDEFEDEVYDAIEVEVGEEGEPITADA